MSYIGSARKWRPQRFEDLVGQEHIRRTLTNALEAGRLASAYLFSGTRGVGKTTTARILAKALNCESGDGPVAEPCDQCSACEEIVRGSHPDVLEIDGATYTGVDNVRELREGLRYRPARGRYKTVIIDEVHMLSRGAFNALLKTLEEPPPHVVFMFATTELQKVPETILSRCQVFEFRRIAPGVIAEQLSRIAGDQGIEIEEDALRLLARMGEGSMRDAQSLLDQVIAFSGEGGLTARGVEGVLGVPPSEVYSHIISAVAERDARAALRELNEIFDAGHDLRLFCGSLLEFLHDIMVLQSAGDDEALFNLGPVEMEERKELATKLSFAEAHQAYSILQNGEFELRTTTHPRMSIELAVIRMCRLEVIADLDDLIEKIESGASGSAPGSAPAPGSPPASSSAFASGRGGGPESSQPAQVARSQTPGPEPAGSPPAGASPPEAKVVASPTRAAWNPEEVRRVWAEALKVLRPSQRELLKGMEADLTAVGIIKIIFPSDNGHAQAFEMVREAVPSLEAYFGAEAVWPVKVVLEESLKEPPPAPADPALEGERKKRKESEEAFIQEVIDIFDGQISNIRQARNKGGQANGDR